jgi:primosomal protein N' (replication factor Y)
LSADSVLRIPDYRGSERAFSLLTQVSGRSGRGEFPGKVILQSYAPEHPLVQAVQLQNYLYFYREEIQKREKRFEPPFSFLAHVLVTAVTPQDAFSFLKEIASGFSSEIQVRGPQAARAYRQKGYYRYQLVLKASERETLLKALQSFTYKPNRTDLKVSITMDPLQL